MNDNIVLIVAAEARTAVRQHDELADRCRAAMESAAKSWITTDEDARFRGAIAAVLLESTDDEERARIEHELTSLRSFSALASGVPVDIEAMLADAPTNPIGLMKMWHEVTGAPA